MPQQRIDVKEATEFEPVLGYKFKKRDLLLQALTHKSAILEKHPMAFVCDLSSLAFVGDAVLKYAVARYLFLNGRDNVIENRAELHQGAQAIIPNRVLAVIAREKLNLDQYIVRGNGCKTISEDMYADCMEAIFGAIALDCENDQHQVIFRVIEHICYQGRIEKWLLESTQVRFVSASHENKWTTEDTIDWPKILLESASLDRRPTATLSERSYLQMVSRLCLWFAFFGFIMFCWIHRDYAIYHTIFETYY